MSNDTRTFGVYCCPRAVTYYIVAKHMRAQGDCTVSETLCNTGFRSRRKKTPVSSVFPPTCVGMYVRYVRVIEISFSLDSDSGPTNRMSRSGVVEISTIGHRPCSYSRRFVSYLFFFFYLTRKLLLIFKGAVLCVHSDGTNVRSDRASHQRVVVYRNSSVPYATLHVHRDSVESVRI